MCRALLSLFVFFASFVFAGEEKFLPTLKEAGVSDRIVKMEASVLPGWVQVWLKGGKIIYVSEDGNYLLQGSLIEKTSKGLVNITQEREKAARVVELEQLNPESFITYKSPNMVAYITVFTDVGCPFCQKFHREVPALTAKGVGVRYLPFPRSGLGGEDFNNLNAVWCADEQVAAFERALKNKKISNDKCEAPAVAESFSLGRWMGVVGTPAIVFADGDMRVGYMDAESILEKLGLK